ESETIYIAPETELERTIANVLQAVLRIEQVSTLDNFFDLGAHSILLVKAHSLLQKTLNREIPLIELFKCPTINSLAKHLSQEQSIAGPARLVSQPPPILALSRENDLPLSSTQTRLWFLDQLDPGNPSYNNSVVARLERSLDPATLERCLN